MADGEVELKTDIQGGEALSKPFENILNFRDVGKTINDFLGEKYVLLSRFWGHW
jgi:protein-tyrosine phosphatase